MNKSVGMKGWLTGTGRSCWSLQLEEEFLGGFSSLKDRTVDFSKAVTMQNISIFSVFVSILMCFSLYVLTICLHQRIKCSMGSLSIPERTLSRCCHAPTKPR